MIMALRSRSTVFIGLSIVAYIQLYGQDRQENRFIGIGTGMGVLTHSAPSLADYINTTSMPMAGQQVDEFSSAVELFVAPEVQISDEWALTLEYAALLKSHSINGRGGFLAEFSYVVHMPSVLVHHIVPGEGYRLKFGGGMGYHAARFEQRFPEFGDRNTFTAGGLGITLDATGHTQFDELFYGLVGVQARWDFLGTLRHEDGSPVVNRSDQASPTMNFFSIGLRLGFLIRLN